MFENNIFEASPFDSKNFIAFLEFDLKGSLTQYSEFISLSNLYGVACELPETLDHFPHPLKTEIKEGINECKKNNYPVERNFHIPIEDAFYSDRSVSALFIPENNLSNFKVIITFTGIKETKTSFNKFEKVFQLTQVGLCLDIIDGKYVGLVNNAFAELHGYTADEMKGLLVEDLFPPESQAEVKLLAQKTDATSHSSFETIHIKKDGTRFPVLVDATVVRSDMGDFLCRIISIRDLTDLKLAQEKLQRINQSLEAEVKLRTEELRKAHGNLRFSERLMLIGTMAAGVAHEINNPLNTMRMGIEIALRQEKKGLPVEKILEDLRDQIDRCASVTRSVLRLGKRDVKTEDLIIDEALQIAVKLVCSYVMPPVETVFELNAKGMVIQASQVEIEQLLTNLLQNASQASLNRVTVIVRTTIIDNSVEIQVEDNAGGISPEILPKIFDPFISTKTTSGGTGLGLSLVKRIVEKYGGDIKVSTKDNVGTIFKIRFPILKSSNA